MSLYCQKTGQGAPLVLLHGWGMNAAVWEPILPTLAEHFEVNVIELPGHGASPPAPAAELRDWAQLCLDVAPRRAQWIGWSLGGQVALQAALMVPARVGRLSLVGTTPRFVQSADWPCAMPTSTFEQFARALDEDANSTLMRFLSLQVKGAEHARETLKQLRDEVAQRPPASAEGLSQGLELLLRTDLRGELAELACPTHWWFGARDTLVPSAITECLGDWLPAGRIDVIDGAGHAPFLSHPQESLDLLLDFLPVS